MELNIQLYTLREIFKTQSTDTVMKKIKSIGYTGVQSFGGKENLIEFAEGANRAGLKVIGHLADLDTYVSMGDEIFNLCKKYGINDLGVSSRHDNIESVLCYIEKVNEFAKKAKLNNISFSYHNHHHEFIKLDSGKTVMDYFMEGFDTDTVDFMPDTYWLQAGGFDVRRFLEINSGRIKILHLKDMKLTPNGQSFAEVGEGNLYFKGIIKTAKNIGVIHYVVEQDICESDPLCSIEKSFNYLKKENLI